MMMQKSFLLCLVSSLIGAAPIGGADRLIGVHRRKARMGSGSFRYHERLTRQAARPRRSDVFHRLFRVGQTALGNTPAVVLGPGEPEMAQKEGFSYCRRWIWQRTLMPRLQKPGVESLGNKEPKYDDD